MLKLKSLHQLLWALVLLVGGLPSLIAEAANTKDLLRSPVVPRRPQPGVFVIDRAKVLTPRDRTAVHRYIRANQLRQGVPIYVVTVSSLKRYGFEDVEEFAAAIYSTWKLDPRSVVLVGVTYGRQGAMHFGDSWRFTAGSRGASILKYTILPYFKRRQFSAGIMRGVARTAEMKINSWDFLSARYGGILAVIGCFMLLSGFLSIRKHGLAHSWPILLVSMVVGIVVNIPRFFLSHRQTRPWDNHLNHPDSYSDPALHLSAGKKSVRRSKSHDRVAREGDTPIIIDSPSEMSYVESVTDSSIIEPLAS